MSLRDPDQVRPGRVALSIAMVVLALVAAGVAGWGFSGPAGASSTIDSTIGHHFLAAFVGLFASILLLVGAGFVLPVALRTSATASLYVVLVGLELLIMSGGEAVGNGRLDVASGITAVPAVVLIVIGSILMINRHARRRRSDEVGRTGTATIGTITSSSIGSYVNGVPRRRLAVAFDDQQGRRRWTVAHATTFRDVPVGQQVRVRYDPKRPGDKHRIFVDL